MVFDLRDATLPLLVPGILLLMGYAILSAIGLLPWFWQAGLAFAHCAVLAGDLVISDFFHCRAHKGRKKLIGSFFYIAICLYWKIVMLLRPGRRRRRLPSKLADDGFADMFCSIE
jgi:hypothetical protein